MPDAGEQKDGAESTAAVTAKTGRYIGTAGTPARIPRRLSELKPGERRRAVLGMVAILIVIWSCLIAVYYALPGGTDGAADAFPRLALGLVAFAAVLIWENSRIGRVELPELRAVRSLGSAIPLFLTVFATIYLSLSRTSPGNFSQHLDHTRALYFTITVFSTVGFGDITPTTDAARIMVSVQMLADLVIVALVVRLLVHTAKTSLLRASHDAADSF